MVKIAWTGKGWWIFLLCFVWPFIFTLLGGALGLKGRASIGIGFLTGGLACFVLDKPLNKSEAATAWGAGPKLMGGLVMGLGVIFLLASVFVAPEES